MQPFEIAREAAAGTAAATAFLVCHYALTFPHWQLPGVAPALETAVALTVYTGVQLAWADRPGLLERWLGFQIPLRQPVANNDPESLRASLQFTVDAARPNVTEPVQEEIDRVVAAIEAVLASWDDADIGREAAYTVRATIEDYLPDTLERYLKLPRHFATTRQTRGEKTPRDLVIEQLHILSDEIYKIADEINAENAADLAAHSRFLEERFSRHSM